MTTRLPGRPTIVLRLSGREDGSVLKLFRRAVMTLTLSDVVSSKELYTFCDKAAEHFGDWEELIKYCGEWMVVQ